MNNKQEDFKVAVERLQARAEELKEVEGFEMFEKLLNGLVIKGVASLVEDYLWSEQSK